MPLAHSLPSPPSQRLLCRLTPLSIVVRVLLPALMLATPQANAANTEAGSSGQAPKAAAGNSVQTDSGHMPLTHDLHVALNKALAENGIEIPFPQQDIHLRSVEADLAPFHTETAERNSGKPEHNPVQA